MKFYIVPTWKLWTKFGYGLMLGFINTINFDKNDKAYHMLFFDLILITITVL